MTKTEYERSSEGTDARVKLETLQKQQARRDREPLYYCKIIAKHPLKAFLFTIGCHLSMMVVSGILLAVGYDLLPIYLDDFPAHLYNEPWQARVSAWMRRTSYPGFYDRNSSSGFRSQPDDLGNIHLYFEMDDKSNVFTRENLRWMEQLENQLVAVQGYGKYCQLDLVTRNCSKPRSLMRYFDGTYRSLNSTFYDPNFERIQEVLTLAATHPATRVRFTYFLGTDSTVSENSLSSSITRTTIPFGSPVEELAGYTLIYIKKYREIVGVWTGLNMEPVLKDHIRSNGDNFQFNYRSELMWYYQARTQAFKDILWVGASIAFIFFFMLLHTRSLWITVFASFSVIASFVTTNLIYNLVMRIHYLGFFHILSLFILLGIGADDFFVFFDVWRNTACEEYLSVAHRLSDAYRKSAISMFFTSLTTSVAFFSNAISPILATRTFGTFSGSVVLVNYLSVILYFPTVVLMYHTYFEDFQWPCFKCCLKCCKSSHTTEDKYESNISGMPNQLPSEKKLSIQGNNDKNTTDKMNNSRHLFLYLPNGYTSKAPVSVYQSNVKKTVDQNNEVFEMNHYFNDKIPYRGYINPVYIADESIDEYLHMNSDHTNNLSNGYSGKNGVAKRDGDSSDVINIDHSNKMATKVKKPKKPLMPQFFREYYFSFITNKYLRWANLFIIAGTLGFFIYKATKQQPDNELDFCETLQNMDDGRANLLRLRKSPETQKYEVRCFFQNMAEFFAQDPLINGHNLTFPYTKENVLQFMRDRPQFYNVSQLNENFTDYLQIPISYWLSNRYTYVLTDDLGNFDPLIGEEKTSYSLPLNTDNTKYYANKIRYIAVAVNTTIKYNILGHEEGIPIRDEWEKFMSEEMAKMPDGLKNGFQTENANRWHWLSVQQILIENAVYGIVIGVSLAFPILVIATKNIVVGTLATFSLCCCTISVIGVIPLGGWKLGALESLNLCMVVGLSVDYVVHLAQAYTTSLHTDRLSRVKDMLDEIGTSVLFGSITSLGAAACMLFTVLTFFKQFGIFMFSTISFSLFFSLGMFTTLMGLIGPQNAFGNMRGLFKRCRERRSE